MIITLRVLLDTEGDVFRDIAIQDDLTFHDLHACIIDAFEWENNQMASFYESNDEWDKGDEIPLMDIAEEFGPNKKRTMEEVILSDVIKEPGQKMLYVFDFMLMWCFYIDIISIDSGKEGMEYPMLMVSVGDTPDQNQKEEVNFKGPESENEDDEEDSGDFNFDELIGY